MERSLDTPAHSFGALSLKELLDRKQQLEVMDEGIDEDLGAFMESLDEVQQQQLEVLYDAYYDTPEDDTSLSMSDFWRMHGQDLMPLALLQRLEAVDISQQEWRLLSEELNERFGEELGRYVRDEAQALLLRLNTKRARRYERWERDQLDHDWLSDLSYVLGDLRGLAERTPVPDYYQASVDFDRLERHRTLLEEQDLVALPDEPKEILYDPEELQRAQDLRVRYRGDFYGRQLDAALETPMLPAHDYKVRLNYEQLDALERHLQSIDIDARLSELDITGIESLPVTLTPEALKHMLRIVPAVAFEGVDAIEFRDIPQDEQDAAHTTELWEGRGVTTGHHAHLPSANRARIVINSQEVARRYHYILESVPNAVIARHIAIEQMMDTVFHEFGHALHYKLPVALLHDWDGVAEAEDVPVSSYVEQMALHRSLDEARREDFADSFKLFLRNPHALYEGAPDRYAAMKDIYSMTTVPASTEDWWGGSSATS